MPAHTRLIRISALLTLITLLTTACGEDRDERRAEHTEGDISDASNDTDAGQTTPDGHDVPDLVDETWDGRLPEACRTAPRGKRPTAAEPNIPNLDREYTIELARWNIQHNAPNHVQTTDAINAAITWAHENNYGTVHLPAGLYIVGKPTNNKYTEAIKLPGNIAFVLDDAAIIEMAPNDTWNYCVVEVSGKTDVIISGGTIRGDRDEHIYEGGGAHDEGHTICVWQESERVRIENTTLTHGTGDGILIVGGGDDGSSSKNITIRNNNIHNQRRQGVSIVGGTNVVIENNEIHHIAGTAPQFGIDIESLKYNSQDILIHNNHFHANKGGDFVNMDGKNVWFEYNICDQTGVDGRQTDGPIVHWTQTDQVIHGNTITVTTGSSNGRWGIIGYGTNERKNPAANYIINNTFHGGGIHMANTTRMHVTGNTINDWLILGTDVSCLLFDDNKINYQGGENYKFRRMLGTAQDNLLNDQSFDLPMSPDEPFTNSPPHMW